MRSGWLQPRWSAPPGVRTAISTCRIEGASDAPFGRFNLGTRAGECVERVLANRAQVLHDLGLRHEPLWLQQVHGSDVVHLHSNMDVGEPCADAAVTGVVDRPLAILTADCLPVLFCSRDGARIGAAHAGWRGLAAGVLENTISALNTPADAVMAWLGPAIGAASYEVGEEVREAFLARRAGHASCFLATRPGHWLCDLAGLARRTLEAAGIRCIEGGGFDTFADARFYSYRRDGARSGRFATLIWLEGPLALS